VRKVRIEGLRDKIPNTVHFAAKMPKEKDLWKARRDRSMEALVCPLDLAGVIRTWALNFNNMESYTLWWNGDSLHERMKENQKVSETASKFDIMNNKDIPIEEGEHHWAFRKNRSKCCWALVYLMHQVHELGILHNDISPYNILFHFPKEKPQEIYIGLCDWGIASRVVENAPSNLVGKN